MKRIRNLSLLTGALLCLFTLAPPLRAQVQFTPSDSTFWASQAAYWLVGKPYAASFTVSGSTVPLLYDPSGAGLTLDMPANFVWTPSGMGGSVSGTFAAPGNYRFSLTAPSAAGTTFGATDRYRVIVAGPLSMVNGPVLPVCNVGVFCQIPLTQGGAPDFSASVVSGSLPPGCSLWSPTIAWAANLGWSPAPFSVWLKCTPTTQGSYTFQVQVASAFGQTGTQSYIFMVGPPGAFYTSTNVMSFSGLSGTAPQTQPLGVLTSDLSTVKFTAASDATWLTASPTSGSTPASLTVQMDPSKLQTGSSTGHLTLTPAGSLQPETVTVTAVIGQPAPRIGVAPESVEVDLTPAYGANKSYQLDFHAWNDGTGTLNAQVSAGFSSLKWLSVQPGQVSLAPGQMQTLNVDIEAGALPAGTYANYIELKSSTQDIQIPVVVVVPATQYAPSLSISSTGYASWPCLDYFTLGSIYLVENPCSPIFVYNNNPGGAMDFTASLTGFGSHAVLQPTQGHLYEGSADGFQLNAQFDGQLPLGRNEGLLTVTAPGAIGSPASAKLGMNVMAPTGNSGTNSAQIDLQVAQPVLVAPAGAQSVTTQVKINNPANVPVTFSVAGSSAAVAFPTSTGVVAAGGTATVDVNVNPSCQAPCSAIASLESYLGTFAATLPFSVVTTAAGAEELERSPGSGTPALSPAVTSCTPSRLVMAPAGPPSLFNRLADWSQNIGAVVFDDCGHALSDASVTASFSNGDAAIALPLNDASKGLYQASWIPGGVAPNMSITLRAMKGSLTPATAQIFGAILDDTGATAISNGGIVNTANPGAPALVGQSITISGANFGTAASGTTVLIGGVQAQLYSVSPSQIVAQVPPSLAPNARYEVVVLAGNSVSTPKPVIVGAAPSIPAPSTVGPSWGSGTSGTFTFTFSDSGGWQSLTVVDVLINNVLDGRQACYVAFVPSSANSGSVYLVDNAGDAGGPYSGMVLPGTGTVSNSQCSIAGAGSSVVGSGSTLTLTLAITFTASFAGNKVMYVAAQDASANSGWQPLGCWDAPGPAVSGPAAGGVSPAHSTAMTQTYTFTFTDTNGWQDISVANVLINSAINGVGACYVAFVPSGAGAGSVYLVDDAGDAAGPYSGMVLPGSGTVHNSQCSIAGAGSSVTDSGNTLTLTLAVTFSSSFTGNRIVYLAAGSNKQNSGWQAMGMAGVQQ